MPRRLAHRAAGEGLLCLVTPYLTRALRQRPHTPSALSLPLLPRGPTALLRRRRSGPKEALESFKSSVRHAYVVDSRVTRPGRPRLGSAPPHAVARAPDRLAGSVFAGYYPASVEAIPAAVAAAIRQIRFD